MRETRDIVERLRASFADEDLADEAAAEIERLRADHQTVLTRLHNAESEVVLMVDRATAAEQRAETLEAELAESRSESATLIESGRVAITYYKQRSETLAEDVRVLREEVRLWRLEEDCGSTLEQYEMLCEARAATDARFGEVTDG